MQIINRHILLDFLEEHPGSRLPLQTWYHLTRRCSWSSPEDIRSAHPDASFITRNWVSLPLKAANCHIVIQVSPQHGLIILRHITFHASEGK